MKHILSFTLLCFVFTTNGQSNFIKLDPLVFAGGVSSFDQYEILDTRYDTITLGHIVKNGEAKPTLLYRPFRFYFGELLDSALTEASKQNNTTWLFHLRNMNFQFNSLTGDNKLKVLLDVYQKRGDYYLFLRKLDSSISLPSAANNRFNKTIAAFIGACLDNAVAPAEPAISGNGLSLADIKTKYSADYRQWPVYAYENVPKGIYASVVDLRELKPMYSDFVGEKEEGYVNFYQKKPGGKKGKLIWSNDFLYVSNGVQTFAWYKEYLYPIKMDKGNFYFVADVKTKKDKNLDALAFAGTTVLSGLTGLPNLSGLNKFDAVSDKYRYVYYLDFASESCIGVKRFKPSGE